MNERRRLPPPHMGPAAVDVHSSELSVSLGENASDQAFVPPAVEDAIRTLLHWVGEDPTREGLVDTPGRVARAWREYCKGYDEDPGLPLVAHFPSPKNSAGVGGCSINI